MSGRRLAEDLKCFPLLSAIDAAAGVSTDSVHLGRGSDLLFLINFGAITGDSILTVASGATAGTATTAETFNYRTGSAAAAVATADIFGAWATSAALTLTAATYTLKMVQVELSGSELTEGQPWVTMAFSSAATVLLVAVDGVLRARYYSGTGLPTAI